MKTMNKQELIEFLNDHIQEEARMLVDVEVFVEDYRNMGGFGVRIPSLRSEYRIALKFERRESGQ